MEDKKELNVTIAIMDHTGDRKINLSCDWYDEEARKELEQTFNNLKRQGYRFYTCKKVLGLFSKKGEEVYEYDPDMGEMIYVKDVKDSQKRQSTLKMQEVEYEDKVRYEDKKPFDEKKERLDGTRDVVAAPRMTAG